MRAKAARSFSIGATNSMTMCLLGSWASFVKENVPRRVVVNSAMSPVVANAIRVTAAPFSAAALAARTRINTSTTANSQ